MKQSQNKWVPAKYEIDEKKEEPKPIVAATSAELARNSVRVRIWKVCSDEQKSGTWKFQIDIDGP